MLDNDVVKLTTFTLSTALWAVKLWREIKKNKSQETARLEVVPMLGKMLTGGLVPFVSPMAYPDVFLTVEVINRGYCPVYINALYLKTDAFGDREAIVIQPPTVPLRPWPIRLERDEQIIMYSQPTGIRELMEIGAQGVYVKTSKNQIFHGTSPVFEALYRIL